MDCEVMGILNVTPDSFSDGGKYFTKEEAVRRAANMLEEGASIIDIGGESTRPGHVPLGWEAEWERVRPVLEEIAKWKGGGGKRGPFRISVDTYHPETAERAAAAGADVVNCVYEEPVAAMLEICGKTGAALVAPSKCFAAGGLAEGRFSGVKVVLDPMIGFGTTREEDVALLKSVPELAKRGKVLVGASRKRIVKKLTGEKATGKNLGGNLAIAVWCALHGASIVRVHDVRETVQALKVAAALEG